MAKDKKINLRVSESDHQKIEAKARDLGISITDYCRDMIFDGQVIFINIEDKKTIKGIAGNLNQLSMKANYTSVIPKEVTEELQKILRILRHAYSQSN